MTEPEQLEQRRRNIAVMDLLTRSVAAHLAGDATGAAEAMAQAYATDAQTVAVLTGGMVIGEVPNPQYEPDEWAAYVAANRDGLARFEQADGGGQDQAPDTTGEDTPQ